jgi:hypothetical protein
LVSRFPNHSSPSNDKRAERCANQIWDVGMMPAIGAPDTGRMGSGLARALLQAGYPSGTRQQNSQEAIQAFIINQSWNAYEKRTPASPARNKNHVGEARFTTARSGGRSMTNNNS